MAPVVRRALGRHDVDCVLDGEVISWDNKRKEVIPFGMNTSVAKYRNEYLEQRGMLKESDTCFDHDGKNAVNFSGPTTLGQGRQVKDRMEQNEEKMLENSEGYAGGSFNISADVGEDLMFPGKNMWLTYVIFDILYLAGPGTMAFLEEIGSSAIFEGLRSKAADDRRSDVPVGGSIMHVDLCTRKKILYNLIEEQKNELELCLGQVITSDGRRVEAREYFKNGGPESDVEIHKCMRKTDEDEDEEIEKKRSKAIDSFFNEVVEKAGEEGLVFKELSSPYLFGTGRTRSKGYWRKLKKDYAGENAANDLDVIVLGAYFADGQHRRGMITAYLVGLANNEPDVDGKLRYLPFTKVSGATLEEYSRAEMYTGFKRNEQTKSYDLGNWWISDRDRSITPDHISSLSFQRYATGDEQGWTATKDDWPDVWIKPEHSFLLEVKAAEVTPTNEFSAGIGLRFPRIERMRFDSDDHAGGEKQISQCLSLDEMKKLYMERKNMERMKRISDGGKSRFLTKRELQKANRDKRMKDRFRKPDKSVGRSFALANPSNVVKKTRILEGLTFCVLPGAYSFQEGSIDADEAKHLKYYKNACKVKSKQHVEKFIFQHGGKCVLETQNTSVADYYIGGSLTDPKVGATALVTSLPARKFNATAAAVHSLEHRSHERFFFSFLFYSLLLTTGMQHRQSLEIGRKRAENSRRRRCRRSQAYKGQEGRAREHGQRFCCQVDLAIQGCPSLVEREQQGGRGPASET